MYNSNRFDNKIIVFVGVWMKNRRREIEDRHIGGWIAVDGSCRLFDRVAKQIQ